MVAYWRACYISVCTMRSDFLGTDSVLFSAKLLHFSCAIFVRTKRDTPVSKVFLNYNFCLFEKTTNKKGRNVWPDSWSLRNSVGEMPAGYLWAFPKAKFRESDSPWNLYVFDFLVSSLTAPGTNESFWLFETHLFYFTQNGMIRYIFAHYEMVHSSNTSS